MQISTASLNFWIAVWPIWPIQTRFFLTKQQYVIDLLITFSLVSSSSAISRPKGFAWFSLKQSKSPGLHGLTLTKAGRWIWEPCLYNTTETWTTPVASESFTGTWELVKCHLSSHRPCHLLSDPPGPTCMLNSCVPNPVHPHRSEEETSLTYFSGQVLTGEREKGRGSVGHKIFTSTLPVKAVSGLTSLCHSTVSMILLRAARSQDKMNHPFFDKTWQQCMPHIKNTLLFWQQWDNIFAASQTTHSS